MLCCCDCGVSVTVYWCACSILVTICCHFLWMTVTGSIDVYYFSDNRLSYFLDECKWQCTIMWIVVPNIYVSIKFDCLLAIDLFRILSFEMCYVFCWSYMWNYKEKEWMIVGEIICYCFDWIHTSCCSVRTSGALTYVGDE